MVKKFNFVTLQNSFCAAFALLATYLLTLHSSFIFYGEPEIPNELKND